MKITTLSKNILMEKTRNNNLENNKETVYFDRPPYNVGGNDIWTYTQFKLNILKTSPLDFLNIDRKSFVEKKRPDVPRLTHLASFVERYLEEDEMVIGISHLKEILEMLSEDLQKYHPLFYSRIKIYLDSEVLKEVNETFFDVDIKELWKRKNATELDIERINKFVDNLPKVIESFENSSAFKNSKERETWKGRMRVNIDSVISILAGVLNNYMGKAFLDNESQRKISWQIRMLIDVKEKLSASKVGVFSEGIKKIIENWSKGTLDFDDNEEIDPKDLKVTRKIIDEFDAVKTSKENKKKQRSPLAKKSKNPKNVTTFKHLGKGLTLKEALKHSLPTKDSSKVKCKNCGNVYNKRHFYGHYKKHIK